MNSKPLSGLPGSRGFCLGDVRPRDAEARGKGLAVEANLDGANARRIQRPAGDRHARPDDGFRRRRVDRADGSRGALCGRNRCGRGGLRVLLLAGSQRVELEPGDRRDDGKESQEDAQRAALLRGRGVAHRQRGRGSETPRRYLVW